MSEVVNVVDVLRWAPLPSAGWAAGVERLSGAIAGNPYAPGEVRADAILSLAGRLSTPGPLVQIFLSQQGWRLDEASARRLLAAAESVSETLTKVPGVAADVIRAAGHQTPGGPTVGTVPWVPLRLAYLHCPDPTPATQLRWHLCPRRGEAARLTALVRQLGPAGCAEVGEDAPLTAHAIAGRHPDLANQAGWGALVETHRRAVDRLGKVAARHTWAAAAAAAAFTVADTALHRGGHLRHETIVAYRLLHPLNSGEDAGRDLLRRLAGRWPQLVRTVEVPKCGWDALDAAAEVVAGWAGDDPDRWQTVVALGAAHPDAEVADVVAAARAISA